VIIKILRKLKAYTFRPQDILANPLFLAVAASSIIILLLPLKFPKYQAEITRKVSTSALNKTLMYEDIDGNGYGDMIFTGKNPIENSFVGLYYFPGMKPEQWNFRGEYNFVNNEYLITGDYDADGSLEIYVFTMVSDSIFLHGIDCKRGDQPIFINRFIAKVGSREDKTDASIIPAEMDDLNEDGQKELVFGINTGYSIYPRNVYAYNIACDSLYISPRCGYPLTAILQADINGDGKKEIIHCGCSTDNIHDKNYPFHDACSWLMVLDRQLSFIFPPVEFPGSYSSLDPFVIHDGSKVPVLCALLTTPDSAGYCYSLLAFDLHGKIVSEKPITPRPGTKYGVPFRLKEKGTEYVGISSTEDKGKLLVYDHSFKLLREHQVGFIIHPRFDIKMDLDGDSKQEYILPLPSEGQLIILRDDFSHPVRVKLNLQGMDKASFSLKLNGPEHPELSVRTRDEWILISYGLHPMYHGKWAIYAGIYLGVLLFTLFIQKLQKDRLKKRYDTEKKITELQLKIVRNQLDPHFAFNALNSAIAAIDNQQKEEAGTHLQHFAQMYRSLVLSSDKFKRTLAEELEFTRNYVEMEKFRYKDRFGYAISIDPAVSKDWEVPKMVIQSHVENALKHGLLGRKEPGGKLEIKGSVSNDSLCLEIVDNGIGREEAAEAGLSSTGKGLQIMDDLYDLYYKVTRIRITAEISDLRDDDGKARGTLVKIMIPLKES